MPSGTLTSITNLATSLARNMDQLSLDEEHYNRQEEWRRQLPESLGEGLRQGLSRLGISLLGKGLNTLSVCIQLWKLLQGWPHGFLWGWLSCEGTAVMSAVHLRSTRAGPYRVVVRLNRAISGLPGEITRHNTCAPSLLLNTGFGIQSPSKR